VVLGLDSSMTSASNLLVRCFPVLLPSTGGDANVALQ
jgi:hypothetical protein